MTKKRPIRFIAATIFHDDVYKNADDASPLPVDGLNLGIAEISDEKENKEPYIPKDDIVG